MTDKFMMNLMEHQVTRIEVSTIRPDLVELLTNDIELHHYAATTQHAAAVREGQRV